jgi:hypothetical protein
LRDDACNEITFLARRDKEKLQILPSFFLVVVSVSVNKSLGIDITCDLWNSDP